MRVERAELEDLEQILALQYLAYQSEARLLNDFTIQPLTQTLPEVEEEFSKGIILKALDDNGRIAGSVRAYANGDTCFVGKLFVHPEARKKGVGTQLLGEIERVCRRPRYELFTSSRSLGNIRLYEKNGYSRFAEKELSPVLTFVYMEKRCGL